MYRSYFVCFEIWFLFKIGFWELFLSFVIRMGSEFFFFFFFLSCVFSFLIFLIWMLRKLGNEKENKKNYFVMIFPVSQFWFFFELFCSRKTKNLLKNMEVSENELLGNSSLMVNFIKDRYNEFYELRGFCMWKSFLVFKKGRDEREREREL